jgi:hypothetical protein
VEQSDVADARIGFKGRHDAGQDDDGKQRVVSAIAVQLGHIGRERTYRSLMHSGAT